MTIRNKPHAILLCLLCIVPLVGCSRGCSSAKADSLAGGRGGPQSPGGNAQGAARPHALAADYERQCSNQQKPTRNCEILRGLLAVEVTLALQEIERSGDQRGTEEALAALALDEEPEIVIAACRILGKFPQTPGLAAKLLPFVLTSPYVEVQHMAAKVLSEVPDAEAAEVGRLWVGSHSDLPPASSAYEEYPDFPAHYSGIGFPAYPGAEWFSPADSDRSVGWSTKDDVAAVSRWFGEQLRAEVLNEEQWAQFLSEQSAASPVDEAKLARMQQLMEKVLKGDQTATAELEKLQKEMNTACDNAGAANDKAVSKVANPPGSSAGEARWIVAQRKGQRISKLVLVYPLSGVGRTVIQLVWDLAEYPNAWPRPSR